MVNLLGLCLLLLLDVVGWCTGAVMLWFLGTFQPPCCCCGWSAWPGPLARLVGERGRAEGGSEGRDDDTERPPEHEEKKVKMVQIEGRIVPKEDFVPGQEGSHKRLNDRNRHCHHFSAVASRPVKSSLETTLLKRESC